MSIFQAIILGLVQGLTEFLPVSSSAHLTLVPWFLRWSNDPGLPFDVALHWGTLIAVSVYYLPEIKDLFIGAVGSLQGQREFANKIPWMIVAATLPGVVAGVLIEHQAESSLRAPALIAVTMSVMGVLLFMADKKGGRTVPFNALTWKQALLIGFSQCLALIPGVSRSGITMTSGLFTGLTREACVKFSFLLAVPITLGAGVLKVRYIFNNANDPTIWAGILTSALSGFMAIHLLTKFVKTQSFLPFVIYRVAMAAFILITLWLR